jgi:hypothetical protein
METYMRKFLALWIALAAVAISSATSAQFGGCFNCGCPACAAAAPAGIAYTPTDKASGAPGFAASFTEGSLNIGSANANRQVLFTVFADIASGALTATVNSNPVSDVFSTPKMSVYLVNLPTGTTASLTVTSSGPGIGAYAVAVGHVITPTATPTDTQIQAWNFNASPGTLTANLTIPSGGVGVAFGLGSQATASGTPFPVTWAGGAGWANAGSTNETWNGASNGAFATAASSTTAGASNPEVTGSNGAFSFSGTGMLALAFGP